MKLGNTEKFERHTNGVRSRSGANHWQSLCGKDTLSMVKGKWSPSWFKFCGVASLLGLSCLALPFRTDKAAVRAEPLDGETLGQVVDIWALPVRAGGGDNRSHAIALTCHSDGDIRVWQGAPGDTEKNVGSADLGGGKVFRSRVVRRLLGGIRHCALSPRASFLSVSSVLEISLFQRKGQEIVPSERTLPPLSARITAMGFSPVEDSLLIGSSDGRVYRWLFKLEEEAAESVINSLSKTKRTLERYVAHNTVVTSVLFHPFAKAFFSGDLGGSLNLWQTYDGDVNGGEFDRNIYPGKYFTALPNRFLGIAPSSEVSGGIVDLNLSADGELLWVARSLGGLEVWRTRGMKRLAQIQAHQGLIYDMTIDPRSGRVYTVGRDGEIFGWKVTTGPLDPVTLVATGEIVKVGSSPALQAQKLAVAEDGTLLRPGENGHLFAVDQEFFKE